MRRFLQMIEQSMTFSEFIKEHIVTGRKLLKQGKHAWAELVFKDLLTIASKQKSLTAKYQEYIRELVVQAWQNYIQNLLKDPKANTWIFIIDAYQRLFLLLSEYAEFKHIANICQDLVLYLFPLENVRRETLAGIIESVVEMLANAGFKKEAIELEMAIILISGHLKPSNQLDQLFQYLSDILLKLGLNYRPMFLYVIMDNSCDFFKMEANEQARGDLLQNLIEICRNAVPSDIRDAIGQTTKFLRTGEIRETEQEFVILAQKLEILNEFEWAAGIIQNLVKILVNSAEIPEALNLYQEFADFSLRRGAFQVSYHIYAQISDILVRSNKQPEAVASWFSAAQEFTQLQQVDLLIDSINRMEELQEPPSEFRNSESYFSVYNEIWNLKSQLRQTTDADFWKMIFYRALFEERDVAVAEVAWDLFPAVLKSKCHPEGSLEDAIAGLPETATGKIAHSRVIVRLVNQQGADIYCASPGSDENLEIHSHEVWNDAQLQDIFPGVISGESDIDLKTLGRLIYLTLPGDVRRTIRSVQDDSSDIIPAFAFVMDSFSVPWELLHDGSTFLNTKVAISTIMLGPGSMKGLSEINRDNAAANHLRILFVANLNSKDPRIWNEETQKETPLYAFDEAESEINDLINFSQTIPEVESISYLVGGQATKEKILATIREQQPHIFHYSGVIFFIEENPEKSYLLTPDGKILDLSEIAEVFADLQISPLL